ncbi:Hsp70 family protein, partial [Streptomyces sp. NPDC006386]
REAAETRNQAEQLVYQTEKFLRDNADKVPSDTKSEVESALADLKAQLDQQADTAALRAGVEKLASVSQKMGQAMYAQAQQTPAEEPSGTPRDEEGVVDAEIVDEEKDRGDEKGGAA